MTMTIEQLPYDIEALKEIIFSQRSEIHLKNQKIQYILEQFNLLRHKQFAASSEASADQNYAPRSSGEIQAALGAISALHTKGQNNSSMSFNAIQQLIGHRDKFTVIRRRF